MAAKHICMDYMKKAKRDALTHQLMYVPNSEEIMGIDQLVALVGPDPVSESEIVEVEQRFNRLDSAGKAALDALTTAHYVEVPEEVAAAKAGARVKVQCGDVLIVGTIVLRRSGPGQVERAVLLNSDPKTGKDQIRDSLKA